MMFTMFLSLDLISSLFKNCAKIYIDHEKSFLEDPLKKLTLKLLGIQKNGLYSINTSTVELIVGQLLKMQTSGT